MGGLFFFSRRGICSPDISHKVQLPEQFVHHLPLWASVRSAADSEAQKCHMAGMTIGGVHSGSAHGGCNESVAHDRLVLGVCALVFELILIFAGGH